MQRKLFKWAVGFPFVWGVIASVVSNQMGANPSGPEPNDTLALLAWLSANYMWSWLSVLGSAFIWPVENFTDLRWGQASGGEAALMVAVSYVVWSAIIPWGLDMLGLWDWFSSWKMGSVEQELHAMWVRLRDWIEEITAFGKGPAAKWAGMADMRAGRWRRGDIFLGRPWTRFGSRSWPVGVSTEKHMVTIAGTGSGKSTGALVPNLCLHQGSLLCIDPKGELARLTARRRGQIRHRKRKGLWQGKLPHCVYVLDPFGISGKRMTDSYNPFDEMAWAAIRNPERVVSFAARIAEALVKEPSQNDPYWDNSAKTFITALVLYIYFHEPNERKTLVRLRELLTRGDVEGYEAAVAAGVEGMEELTPFDCLLRKMTSDEAVVKGPQGMVIANGAAQIEDMPERTRGSVMATAREHTAFLDNPMIARVLAPENGTGRFRLDDLKDNDVWKSIYVCLPITCMAGPESRWARLIFLMFQEVMMFDMDRVPNPPVLFAVDEFPNLGRIDRIETVATMMRSYGVRFWAVGQDISQFKDVYPTTWTSFIGGAEAVQFMGLNHPPTVDFLADLLGHHVVSEEMGVRKQIHPLMDRDQLMRFLAKNRENQIIWFGSRRPMKLKICPYFKYLMPWYYDPDPRYRESLWRRFLRMVGP